MKLYFETLVSNNFFKWKIKNKECERKKIFWTKSLQKWLEVWVKGHFKQKLLLG